MRSKKKRFDKNDSRKISPAIREFNKIAREFLSMLTLEIEEKEKRINILLQGLPVPEYKHSINIQAIDINKTKALKKGAFAGNITHKWEKDVMRDLNRKIII
jgi:hypothetical protein